MATRLLDHGFIVMPWKQPGYLTWMRVRVGCQPKTNTSGRLSVRRCCRGSGSWHASATTAGSAGIAMGGGSSRSVSTASRTRAVQKPVRRLHVCRPGHRDHPALRPPTASVTWSAAARTCAPTAFASLSDRRKAGPETEMPATGSPWALKIGAATQRIPSARS